MKIDINDFVGKNDVREWLNQPFSINGKLAATDGKTAFLSNQGTELGSPEKADQMIRFFEIAANADFFAVPELTFPEKPICAECDGTGKSSMRTCPECDGYGEAEAETDYNVYEVECRSCLGSGKVKCGIPGEKCERCGGEGKRWEEHHRMQVPGFPFDLNPGLLSRVWGVPGLEIAVLPEKDISQGIAFRCADGLGIILGMRQRR